MFGFQKSEVSHQVIPQQTSPRLRSRAPDFTCGAWNPRRRAQRLARRFGPAFGGGRNPEKKKRRQVAEERQGVQEELSVATAKMKGLEEELVGARQQVAEAQESQERRMLEFQQATAMLKEHSQKFKQQEARKAQQMAEAVRREEKEKMSHLEAELEESGHEVKRLEAEVIKRRDEMTRAVKCMEEEKERDKKEKEVVRERLLELRVQMKSLKEQLGLERARNKQLEVSLAEARQVQQEQLKRLQLLGEEAAEAAGLKQRVLTLESCQHTMGECLKVDMEILDEFWLGIGKELRFWGISRKSAGGQGGREARQRSGHEIGRDPCVREAKQELKPLRSSMSWNLKVSGT
eukprot:s2049_g2.t1